MFYSKLLLKADKSNSEMDIHSEVGWWEITVCKSMVSLNPTLH